MTTVRSAGILLYRMTRQTDRGTRQLEVWIAHMGGPFWARKDDSAWSIPKGEYEPPELSVDAALREFEEEVGSPAPALPYRTLGEFRQRSGKVVEAWTAEFDGELPSTHSNTFELEWPPRSGQMRSFPEIDRAEWFDLADARHRLVLGQRPILDALLTDLDRPASG